MGKGRLVCNFLSRWGEILDGNWNYQEMEDTIFTENVKEKIISS